MPEARAGRLRGEMDSGAAGALSFVSQYISYRASALYQFCM